MPLRNGPLVQLAAYAVVGLMAVVCALPMVWALDTRPPRGSITVSLDGNVVSPWGMIRAEYRVEVLRNCPGIIYFWLVSVSSGDFIQPSEQPAPIIPQARDEAWSAGRPLRFSIPAIKLVPNFPPGEAELRARAFFYCNPLQYVAPLVVDYPIAQFRVLRSEEAFTP